MFLRYRGSKEKTTCFTVYFDFTRKILDSGVRSSIFACICNEFPWEDMNYVFLIFGRRGDTFKYNANARV